MVPDVSSVCSLFSENGPLTQLLVFLLTFLMMVLSLVCVSSSSIGMRCNLGLVWTLCISVNLLRFGTTMLDKTMRGCCVCVCCSVLLLLAVALTLHLLVSVLVRQFSRLVSLLMTRSCSWCVVRRRLSRVSLLVMDVGVLVIFC